MSSSRPLTTPLPETAGTSRSRRPRSPPGRTRCRTPGPPTSPAASSVPRPAPPATCVGSCTLPADTTIYPVAITTAASSLTTYTIYDTPASTGEGVMTLGGSSAANPVGWWVQAPASTRAGIYTSTVTLQVVSGP